MHQLKDFWGTTIGKITILGGGSLLGVVSICFVCTICSAIGSLNGSQEVADIESQSTVQSELATLPTQPTATSLPTDLVQPTTQSELATQSTAPPLPAEPVQPTDTLEPAATSMPTATPEPTFTLEPTPDTCTVEVKQEGRSEPEYVRVQGYVIESYPGNYDDALPSYPWGVPILEQVGPDLWEEGEETLSHKTPVVVLEQHLKHEGFGRYSGFLVVKTLDNSEYRIDHYNFAPTDYWNCSPHQAVRYSSFIARVKEGVKPVNRDGEWVEMGEQKEVFCNGTPGIETDGFVENGVECLMYKEYIKGFGGVKHIFPSDSLEITY